MSSTNAIVIALIIGAVAAVWFFSSKEGFWNIPSRTWKVEQVLERPGPNGPDFFQTPGFQSVLSPRFSNVNYGPYLRTQLPDYGMSGVPADPLGGDCEWIDGATSPYSGKCNDAKSVRFEDDNSGLSSGTPITGGYANGNYQQVATSLVKPDNQSDKLEEGDFGSYLTADGEMKQPVIYDRYIYANRHSRLRGQGDPFRGDLPIVPNTGNWFVPSVHPNIDLQAGAINVMAGVNNETNHQLANLIFSSSGGGTTAIGGVSLDSSRFQPPPRNITTSIPASGDVIMTSFP